MSPPSLAAFLEGLLQSRLLDAPRHEEVMQLQQTTPDPQELARELVRRDWLTAYQANQIFQGKAAGLHIGPYVVLERLGEGGMGQVFKARQKTLQRLVALKVIRKEFLNNPKTVHRFVREIRAASQLAHPHIVRAYDAGQVNGSYYFAMELIEGTDLARLVKDKGALPIAQACEYIRQAALGLQHAHKRGLVHRDIKPANLLVTPAVQSDRRRSSRGSAASSGALARANAQAYPWGIVKILDLGLARWVDPANGRSSIHVTDVGAVMGTPDFIAPEQARDANQSDIRSDLYSLGCTLYFLLAGQAPFPKGTLTEKLLQHQFDLPESVSKVRGEHLPAAIEVVVTRLMAKNPQDRYQTPQELANALQTLLSRVDSKASEKSAVMEKMPVLTPPMTSWTRHKLAKLPKMLAVAGGFCFLFALTAIAALAIRHHRTEACPIAREAAQVNVVKPIP